MTSLFSISSAEQQMTCEEYNATTISLYKEIRALKNRGHLFNDCGFGGCAHPEVKAWKKKWEKHNRKRCTDGSPSLSIPYDDVAYVADLFDVVAFAYDYQGEAAFYKFELALICYENPEICKKYTRPEPTPEAKKRIKKLIDSLYDSKSAEQSEDRNYARELVIQALKLPNNFGITGKEFKTKQNPKGEGIFVYHNKTQFFGFKKHHIWLVINHEAYPFNGSSKMLTDSLKWPIDADQEVWKSTGLNPDIATEAIEIVFGSE